MNTKFIGKYSTQQVTASRLITALAIFYCACAACVLYAKFLAANINQQNITSACAVVFFIMNGITMAFLLRERDRQTDAPATEHLEPGDLEAAMSFPQPQHPRMGRQQ